MRPRRDAVLGVEFSPVTGPTIEGEGMGDLGLAGATGVAAPSPSDSLAEVLIWMKGPGDGIFTEPRVLRKQYLRMRQIFTRKLHKAQVKIKFGGGTGRVNVAGIVVGKVEAEFMPAIGIHMYSPHG